MVKWFYFIEENGILKMVPREEATIAKRMEISDDGKVETQYFDITDKKRVSGEKEEKEEDDTTKSFEDLELVGIGSKALGGK